jgi:hypothetical protein
MLRTVRIILRRVDSPFSLGLINTLTFYTPALGGSIYVPGNQRGMPSPCSKNLHSRQMFGMLALFSGTSADSRP